MAGLIGADGRAGVYWRGNDGNIYTKDNTGAVRNAGSGGGVLASGDQTFGGLRFREISNPNPNVPAQPAQPSRTVIASGGGAPTGPTAAQIDPLLASLASLDTILGNKNAQSEAEYKRAIEGYNAQDLIDRQAYDKNVQTNEQAYTGNNQKALLNAANASTGLRGVLSTLGALGGSGINIVKKLVGLAANEDTGASRDNFETNAGQIGTAWSQAEQQQRQRRLDADATLQNSKQNNESTILTSRQNILQQLAGVYGPDAAQGKEYAAKAGSLAAPIAATSRATIAPYATASSLFSPAALQEYLAGTKNLNVNTSGGRNTPINSPLFGRDKKDQLTGVA